MKIHALTTGAVRVKHSFLFPSRGPRRQLDLFMPGPFSDPLPIHCWAIEHEGVLRLIDAGETAAARNVPFARPEVAREQELPATMTAAGLSLDDVSEDGMALIAQILEIFRNYDFATKVLVASVRHPLHVLESARLGADVATIPFNVIEQLAKHPLTDIGLKKFLSDWEKVPKESK